jgi:lysophospholipase L1-like esterase
VSDTGKKLILLVVAAVMALGAGEIVLRVIGYGAIAPEMNSGVITRMSLDKGHFLPDEDLFWKLPVHPLDVDFRSIQPDVEIPPKGSRRRILVMGDSCSKVSTAIPPYSVLLEGSLRGQDVEVWNAAVLDYTTWQGHAWLARQLLAMKPDVAVVYYGWNDHWRATGITDRNYAERSKKSTQRLALLFQKMPDPPPLRVSVDQYREYLEVVHEVCENKNAQLLDAAALFAAAGDPRQFIMRDGIHLTDEGHQLMAALLTAQLGPVLANDSGVHL